jgi:hypothetical protein
MATLTIKYDYKDVPTIAKFAEDNTFIRGLMGPFGSGKSSGCVMEIIRRGHLQTKSTSDKIRHTRWAVIRNTYRQLHDTTIKTFHDWLPPKFFGRWRETDHDYIIDGFHGVEIEVMFRALDRPDQVANLLSLELTGAWINEAREVPKAIFEALQGRINRFPAVKDGGCAWAGIIMDTNPPDTDHWWYRLFEETKPENMKLFRQPSGLSEEAENLTHLQKIGDKSYYENLAIGKEADFVRVYVHGDYGYVQEGKPIYPEYNDLTHCQEFEALPSLPIYRGWDFGLTPACVLTQLDAFGKWLILDELVSEDMGIDRFSDKVLQHAQLFYPNMKFIDYGDPAGSQRAQTDEKTCFQILYSKNIPIEPAEQELTLRIESVKKPLATMVNGKPGLLIHPRCKVLRKGFQGGYQYRRLHTSLERYTETPDKNMYSHPHDALQYIATRLFANTLRLQQPYAPPPRYRRRARARSWKTA